MSTPSQTKSTGGSRPLKPTERSAAMPTSADKPPPTPPPLIAPNGEVVNDAVSDVVAKVTDPWRQLPNQTPVQQVATVVNQVIGLLNFDVAVDYFNMGVAALASVVPWPALPAAVLGMPHFGNPHTHPHPPSLVPPAPPVPLPSFGTVMVGGCVSVLIGGIPAARAGDLGLAVTCGTLAPPFAIAMGSSSVFIGGSRAARMGDRTKHCGAVVPNEFSAIGAGFAAAVAAMNVAAAPETAVMAAAQTAADTAKAALAAIMGTDPGAPPCLGSVMLGVPNVLIGGLPIPPIENFARAYFQKLLKPLATALKSKIKAKLGPGRANNFFSDLVCHLTGHPVDVASGRMLTSAVDLELAGPLPLKLKRQYATSWCNRDGVLGWGWSHSYDQAVWLEADEDTGTKAVYRAEDGRELEFETGRAERPAWLQVNEHWDPFNRLTLRVLGKAHYEIESVDGLTREFRAVVVRRTTGALAVLSDGGAASARRDVAKLSLIRDRAGNRVTFRYDDAAGNLDTIIDSGGREIRLENDRAGRLERILVPHPISSGFVEQVRYAYSAAGDLVETYDAAGKPFRMAYEGHVLIRETNRNGLSFHFKYEGGGPDARCVKTWGDGDLYTRKLTYDRVNHLTIVEDSYRHKTTYQMNGDNAVVAVTDALGGETKYAFDGAYNKISETDAVGGETKWEYDARGNCTKVTAADGAEVALEYNERNQPIVAIDPVKGNWQWGYDGRGLLVVRVDPLQRRVRFVWQGDPKAAIAADTSARRIDAPPPPKRLVSVVDPSEQKSTLNYDGAGNITSVRAPNGAESRWKYDNLGRCLLAIDPKGNQQLREHDGLGRVIRVREPDGNVREMSYDGEGSLLLARDRQRDIRFAYQGVGRLRARTEANTTIEFEYDRDERLIGIKNEHGHAYRFERGPTGKVAVETGFDGNVRKYERDSAGRVTKVSRPGDRFTRYEYDPSGRVVGVTHSQGGEEGYAYRADGALVQAKNDTSLVTFERDELGRVVKEIVGEDWVESTYDLLGQRVGIRSSRGLDQRIARDAAGQVVGVRATTKRPMSSLPEDLDRAEVLGDVTWEARFERDSVGLELERSLPGGVSARWERDNLGRPKTHTIWSGSVSKAAWHYTWDVNNRLAKLVDLLKGPTQYQYDGFSNLVAAAYSDGQSDLRMPDAVRNLFRTADRSDRAYGPAGQLLEARNADGSMTRYEYDPEGNLIRKVEIDVVGAGNGSAIADGQLGGRVWSYEWTGAGMLRKVVRPDGDAVEFTYDALGRRLSKKFRGATTRWLWDGNVPLHEWIERAEQTSLDPAFAVGTDVVLDEAAARRRQAERAARPAQGPPDGDDVTDQPITWLFVPETFTPMGKIVGDQRFSVVTDHLGAPVGMYDASGVEVWGAATDAYGDLRDLRGRRQDCPFRWPGQYEDTETGLYYNRFRYYDPAAGTYVSRDPIGLEGGLRPTAYVANPLGQFDPFGLESCDATEPEIVGPSHQLPAGKGLNPVLPGSPIVSDILPVGFRFNQAVGPRQKDPGAFGTLEHIPNVKFVRDDLAVIPSFKTTVSGTRVVEVIRPARAQMSTVGPQTEAGVVYPGGASQIQVMDYDPNNPYVKFVGPETPIK